MAREERDEVMPPGGVHFLVKGGSAHDGEFLRLGREKNQEAVLGLGGGEAQLPELGVRGGQGIGHAAMADVEDDVAGGAFLGGPDRVMDAVVLQRAQKVFYFHG
jgi:hypothetical protein